MRRSRTTAGTAHQPDRPSWDCRACDKPWPCDPAREQLTQTYGRKTLSIFAVDRLSEAARDIPTMTPAELYERFLAWTRPAVDRRGPSPETVQRPAATGVRPRLP